MTLGHRQTAVKNAGRYGHFMFPNMTCLPSHDAFEMETFIQELIRRFILLNGVSDKDKCWAGMVFCNHLSFYYLRAALDDWQSKYNLDISPTLTIVLRVAFKNSLGAGAGDM